MIYCIIGKYVDSNKVTTGYRVTEINLNLFDIECIMEDEMYIDAPLYTTDLCFNVTRNPTKFYKDMTVKEYNTFKKGRKKVFIDFFTEVEDIKLPTISGLSQGLQSIVLFKKKSVKHNTDIYMMINENGFISVKTKTQLLKDLFIKRVKNAYKTDDNTIRVYGKDDLDSHLRLLDEKWSKNFNQYIRKNSKKLNNLTAKSGEIFYSLISSHRSNQMKDNISIDQKFKKELAWVKFYIENLAEFVDARKNSGEDTTLDNILDLMKYLSEILSFGSIVMPTLKKYKVTAKATNKIVETLSKNKELKSNTRELVKEFFNFDYSDLILYYIKTRYSDYVKLSLYNFYTFYHLEKLYFLIGTEPQLERRQSSRLLKLTPLEERVLAIFYKLKKSNPNSIRKSGIGRPDFEKLEEAFIVTSYMMFRLPKYHITNEGNRKNANIVFRSENYTVFTNRYINEQTLNLYKGWEYSTYRGYMDYTLDKLLSDRETILNEEEDKENSKNAAVLRYMKELKKDVDKTYIEYIDLMYDITYGLDNNLSKNNIKTTKNDRLVVLDSRENEVIALKTS